MEIVESVDQIRHPSFGKLENGRYHQDIELHSTADVPSSSGLGSSSSFTVALMNALHCYKGEYLSKRRLAEEACQVEIDLLGEPIGKQDQYMAAFGGLTCLTFEKDGNVLVEPLRLDEDVLEELESNLLFFFTGKERNASEILKEQDDKSKQNDMVMVNNLHQIKISVSRPGNVWKRVMSTCWVNFCMRIGRPRRSVRKRCLTIH